MRALQVLNSRLGLSQVGQELTEQGGLAMMIALGAIFIYVLLRFEWRFSAGSVAALFHDVIIVLGFFSVGVPARAYTGIGSDSALIEHMLAELDEMFDGAASRYYVRHVVQNWSKEPFIRGAYSTITSSWAIRDLAETVDGRVHFAGEAYNTRDNWGYVHIAAQAGMDAVDEMLSG